MTISVITPTADRHVAFGLCERWMARQTRQPDEWIVADGGSQPLTCTQGQRHLYEAGTRSHQNFLRNVVRGVLAATGDVIVCMEDDDWYAPTHLERIVEPFAQGSVLASGDDLQQYYNLPRRLWRQFNNKGASLCQTAFRRDQVPLFRTVVAQCQAKNSFGVDGSFWAQVPRAGQHLKRTQTCVGIKGLPGGAGLGIGHRPGAGWTPDPTGAKLRALVGEEDAAVYAQMLKEAQCQSAAVS